MKPTIYLILLIFAATACTDKKQMESAGSAIAFDSIVVEEKIKLLPNEPDSIPYATLKLKFIYPKSFRSETDVQKLQSLFNKFVLGDKYENASTPRLAVDSYIDEYASEYRGDADNFKEFKSQGSDDEETRWYISTQLFEQSISNRIEYVNDSLISFSVNDFSYTGGAHGISNQINLVVNLNSLTTLGESDIFIDGYKEPLAKIIRKKLLKYMKEEVARGSGDTDEEIKEYFFEYDSIYPNGNFFMSDKGLHYTYNSYEVAPYSAGTLEAHIPYGEIGNLLKPELFGKLFPNIDLQKETDNFKTVADMFMLLPDDAFYGDINQNTRKQMIETEEYVGYYRVEQVYESDLLLVFEEANTPEYYVYSWAYPENKYLVSVLTRISGKAELAAYWYENGKFTKDEDFYAFANQNFNFAKEDFFDMDKASERIINDFEIAPYRIDYRISRSSEGAITIISETDYGIYDGEEDFNDIRYYMKFIYYDGEWKKLRLKSRE